MPRRSIAVLVLATLVAACAIKPADRAPAPLVAAPDVAPNFLVPTVRERMVFLAEQEWALFGQPVAVRDGNGAIALEFPADAATTHEAQAPSLSRVMLYWYAVTREPIVGFQGELRAWSAAFISWLARGAGLTADEFPPSIAHWDYIARFLRPDAAARFVARDPLAYAPRVGDLVCASRRAGIREFAALQPGPYHCDLVVRSGPGAIEVIGGNVGDTVALARLAVDERGLLAPRPDPPWVVVLEQRDTR
jgi:hypothetical protein